MNTISMPRSVPALALALAAVLACGGSDTTDPGDGTGGGGGGSNNNVTCTVTLSGALTGSPTCPKVSTDRSDGEDKTSFGFEAADGADTVRVGVFFSGSPTTATYDAGTGATAVVLINNATTGWSTDDPAASWSLTLSSVKATSSGAGLTGYEVHGTFTATAVPSITETSIGPVTLNATF
jgi:hypothetical protein